MASREIIHEEKETMFEEPEIVRNMLKSVGETYDHVKEVVTVTNPKTGNPEKYEHMDYAAVITEQTSDINEAKFGESEFVARKKMGEMKINEEGVFDEAKQKGGAEWETAAEREIAARKNISGATGSMTEAIKDELTYPTDIVPEARASR